MGIDASLIFNTAINLNNGTIEKYLIEEQKNSNYSPQVFFGLLLSHTKKISISKEIEYLNGKVLELTYDLKIFDEEVAPTLSDLSREYNRTKKTKKLEESKAKATNYKLFDEIVNRLSKQSISDSIANPDADSIEKSQEVPLKNEFNRMPIDQVAIFFTPLIETENSSGEKWMTPESFDIFLRRSFGKEESLQKPEINLGKGTKGAIIKLFYKFYSHCINKNYSSKREKEPYVKLIMDAFDTGVFDNLDNDSFNGKAEWEWADFKLRK
jgi:hypothetical protein